VLYPRRYNIKLVKINENAKKKYFQSTTRRYIPEDRKLKISRKQKTSTFNGILGVISQKLENEQCKNT
jgi:hypothetical protein